MNNEFLEVLKTSLFDGNKPVLILLICIAILVYFLVFIIKKKNNAEHKNNENLDKISTKRNNDDIDNKKDKVIFNRYEKKDLLTKREWKFYKEIKPIADKYNLHIIAKVRLSDLVDVKSDLSKSEQSTYLNKIQRKHIDFVLCNPDNLRVLALVELDDTTHNKKERAMRDEFVNDLCKSVDYKLIRLYDSNNFENLLKEYNIIIKE